MTDTLTFAPFSATHLDGALRLSREAVWPHRREDWRLLHQISHGVTHCFTGDVQQLKAYLDLGLYIGITGWVCDERRGEALQQALRYIPSDRLLLETDAPYLLPRTMQPKPKSRRNEPAYLPVIAQMVARLTNRTMDELATLTWQNSQQLFGFKPTLSTAYA